MGQAWKVPLKDTLSSIIAWEQGEATDQQVLCLFQTLVDNGQAWTLQGCYGRTAAGLLEQGILFPAGEGPQGSERGPALQERYEALHGEEV